MFEQFERIGSVAGVLRWLATQELKLPVRVDHGPSKGQLDWRRPSLTTVRNVLTHPMYAGAYVYGRTCQNPTSRRVRGVPQRLPREEWRVLLKDRHPAYISWQEYERNVSQIDDNRSLKNRRGAVRQGRALLAGLLVCGRCGYRMMTRYQGKSSQPRYLCDRDRALYGGHRCQGVAAASLDEEVTRLALLALTRGAVDVSLRVAEDIDSQREKIDSQWRSRLERATYAADRAGRQFNATEPENRLVARTLEKSWEEKLREVQQMAYEYARFQQEQPLRLTAVERHQVQELTMNLPALWQAPTTTEEDRKTILRQLVERVEVDVEGDTEWVELRIHWAGGHETYSRIRRPVGGTAQLSQWPNLLKRLKELKYQGLSTTQIAVQLHQEGFRPAKGGPLTPEIVRNWLSRYGISSQRKALSIKLSSNEWTIPDLMARYRLSDSTIHGWIRRGEVQARQLGDAGSRWIIQALPQKLDQLASSRRTPPKPADENSNCAGSPAPKSVTRGAL
jgi:recombinase/recombinase-like zinc beta ribbon protein